jgi:hypothetical protein
MTDKITCEIFLAVNEDGDWIVANDESEALQKLGEDAGGYQARVVKVIVKVAPPVMTEVAIEVADEAGETADLVETETA